jgi:hypothetical protein
MSQRDAEAARPLLARILDTPNLARAVPRLQPEVLHRIIERCGLEDSGDLVSLATPEQLAAVFDLDLWRSRRPGGAEQFDPERFAVWLEVLVDADVTAAARTLAGVDARLVTAALAQYVLVFDPAAVQIPGDAESSEPPIDRASSAGVNAEIGGYLIVARSNDTWDAIVAVLIALEADHRDAFDRILAGCRALSNSIPEIDGLDNLLMAAEQVMFDVASDREQRRERQGYVTTGQARAFLQMARQLKVSGEAMPPQSPLATAYFRDIEEPAAETVDPDVPEQPSDHGSSAPEDPKAIVRPLLDVLVVDGLLPTPPRALLDAPEGSISRLSLIQAQLRFCDEHAPAASTMRNQELAFLSNTLLAGCAIQARAFTLQEASAAAVATCNLGLEHWPEAAPLPEDFLVEQDLVAVFQVGWSVIHGQVCMVTAERLLETLARLSCRDRDVQQGLVHLRRELTRSWQAGTPWMARDALDVIMTLDTPAWAALVGLIDECPVVNAAIGRPRTVPLLRIDPSAFDFISEGRQIARVYEFLDSLPATLRG